MKISLILLAAGNSRRFGGNKLLAHVDGKPMYLHIADEIEELGEDLFCQKIIVTQYPEILSAMADRGYEAIANPGGGTGIASSIKLGLKAASGQAACFAVCDQPYLKGVTVRRFLEGWIKSGCGAGSLSCQGMSGNPAVFSEKYFGELMELTGDRGGKKVLARHPEDWYMYEVEDKRELEDIDIRRNI